MLCDDRLFRYDPQSADGRQLVAGLTWLTTMIPLRAERFARIHPRADVVCANAAWRVSEGLALTVEEVRVILDALEQLVADEGLDWDSARVRRFRPLLRDRAAWRTRQATRPAMAEARMAS